jgi:Flp pilus assembly protein TadB
MLMPIEYGGILASIVCFALLIWNFTSMICQWLHWPVWTRLAMLMGLIGVVVAASLIVSLCRELRSRREHREQAEMEQRYPDCRVKRLASGKWFLTDRSTGREYRPDVEQP